MKTEFLELPVQPLEGCESPSVTALHAQKDGSILCGLAFANPCLFRLGTESGKLEATDLQIEKDLGKDAFGILNGLRSATSGDTAFAVVHEGFAPGFLRKLSGGELRGRTGEELMKFLLEQDGGMGVSVRHSVVQVTEGEVVIRRYREPGVLIDAAHIGDFVFGLHGSSIWREPYLNTEKRETLRKDLQGNTGFHRDNAGNFWFLGQGGRFLRMGQTDIKAKPTILKFPKWTETSRFEVSAGSIVDEWLYGVADEGKMLFRVRVNEVSHEDEFQIVGEFPNRISSLAFIGNVGEGAETAPLVAKATLVAAFESSEGAELWTAEVAASEDPELQSVLPKLARVGRVAGVDSLVSLSWDGKSLWAGEGRLGDGKTGARKPRVVRITEL